MLATFTLKKAIIVAYFPGGPLIDLNHIKFTSGAAFVQIYIHSRWKKVLNLPQGTLVSYSIIILQQY